MLLREVFYCDAEQAQTLMQVNPESTDEQKDYYNILVKSLERYIERVPYMSNAVITQLNKVNTLDELCDLTGSFLTIDYTKKKKYITGILIIVLLVGIVGLFSYGRVDKYKGLVKVSNVMPEEAFLEDMIGSFKHKFAKKPEVIDGNMKALEMALKEVEKVQ